MNTIKLYVCFIRAFIKTKIEYRLSFFMDFFTHIYGYSLSYAGIWVILNKFNMINGWNIYQIIFLFSLNLLSYGITGIFFFSPLRRLEFMIRDGSFDSLLIRPMNPFIHLVVRYFNNAFLGHVIISAAVLCFSITKLNIKWTAVKSLMLLLFIFGAVLIQSGLIIISASLSFWWITGNASIDMTIYGLRRFIDYPLSIYNRSIQIILTFIIPYGFVNFYPASYFFSDLHSQLFFPLLNFISPGIGLLIFVFSLFIWSTGLKRYQSTGT